MVGNSFVIEIFKGENLTLVTLLFNTFLEAIVFKSFFCNSKYSSAILVIGQLPGHFFAVYL